MTLRSVLRSSSPLDEASQSTRRAVVAYAMVGFPALVVSWFGLSALGLPDVLRVVVAGALIVGLLVADYFLWVFRRSLAQSPDEQLDEREVAVRDRAYLESYRVFTALTAIGVLVVAIAPDVLDRPLELTFETVQPVFWGVLHYALVLPSAFIAWREPDVDA